MSDDTTMQTGVCACGTTVNREIPAGAFAGFAASLPFVCADCQRLAAEEEEAEQARQDRARVERHRRLLMEHSGLPEGLRGMPLEQPDAIAWADRRISGLLLTGPVGVGKTTAAAAAAERFLRSGRPLRWTSAPVLFARLGTGLGTRQRDDAIDTLTGRHALVLDDIDKARPTEYAAEHVFLAVDTRLTERQPLLCTSNLGMRELAERWPDPFGEAIASRIAGYCRVVRVDGADRRIAA